MSGTRPAVYRSKSEMATIFTPNPPEHMHQPSKPVPIGQTPKLHVDRTSQQQNSNWNSTREGAVHNLPGTRRFQEGGNHSNTTPNQSHNIPMQNTDGKLPLPYNHGNPTPRDVVATPVSHMLESMIPGSQNPDVARKLFPSFKPKKTMSVTPLAFSSQTAQKIVPSFMAKKPQPQSTQTSVNTSVKSSKGTDMFANKSAKSSAVPLERTHAMSSNQGKTPSNIQSSLSGSTEHRTIPTFHNVKSSSQTVAPLSQKVAISKKASSSKTKSKDPSAVRTGKGVKRTKEDKVQSCCLFLTLTTYCL